MGYVKNAADYILEPDEKYDYYVMTLVGKSIKYDTNLKPEQFIKGVHNLLMLLKDRSPETIRTEIDRVYTDQNLKLNEIDTSKNSSDEGKRSKKLQIRYDIAKELYKIALVIINGSSLMQREGTAEIDLGNSIKTAYKKAMEIRKTDLQKLKELGKK